MPEPTPTLSTGCAAAGRRAARRAERRVTHRDQRHRDRPRRAIGRGRIAPGRAALGEAVEVLFGAAAPSAIARWAWPSPTPDDARMWRATVSDRVLAYPVEPTAAGAIAHDAEVTPSEHRHPAGSAARSDAGPRGLRSTGRIPGARDRGSATACACCRCCAPARKPWNC